MKKFEWDEAKNKLNIEKHAIDFVEAHKLFDHQMFICEDTRKDYLERRYIGMGYIKNRVMVVAYTERLPNIIRIISLRRANKREQKKFNIALKNRLEAP